MILKILWRKLHDFYIFANKLNKIFSFNYKIINLFLKYYFNILFIWQRLLRIFGA